MPDLPTQVDQLSAQYQEVISVRQADDSGGKRVEDLLGGRSHLVVNRRMNDLTVSQWSTK